MNTLLALYFWLMQLLGLGGPQVGPAAPDLDAVQRDAPAAEQELVARQSCFISNGF